MGKRTEEKSGDTAEKLRRAEEFQQAILEFRSLIDAERMESLQPMGPATVYTSLVTVWLLVYQRLHAGGSLLDAVHELQRTAPQHLPPNRRVREGTLSSNTGAYSRARTRLKPEVTDELAHHIFHSLLQATRSQSTSSQSTSSQSTSSPSTSSQSTSSQSTSSPSTSSQSTSSQSTCSVVAGRHAFLLDGTTIALAPTRDLKQAYPPALNQYGSGVWPIAHLVVAHELETGCALLPEVGAKFGPEAQSEPQLAHALFQRLPPRSLVIADRNFGIFSVAHAARQAGHDVLVRMTEQRFRALQRQARKTTGEEPSGVWKATWRPSKKDRQTNPGLPAEAALEVLLYELPLSDSRTLFLLTTWPCPASEAAQLYRRRLDVETDIRDVKVLLNLERLPAKSVDMLRKELAVSMIAYNLVVQVRRLAAQRAGVPPRRISFAGTWSAVRVILIASQPQNNDDWPRQFELAIRSASQHKLPHRPNRSYPRQALTKRNKSTSGRKHKPPPTTPPPTN